MRSRVGFILIVALWAAQAGAYETGITGFSGKQNQTCAACHAGGTAPEVRFEGPSEVEIGATVRFRFVLVSEPPSQDQAGFNVAASGGTLRVVTGQRSRSSSGELTHSDPKDVDRNDEAAWEFDWIAPDTAGQQTLYGAGNAVNGNGQPTGDRSAKTTLKVQVGAAVPTPSPTATVTVVATATPTDIPSVTMSNTVAPSATSSPTVTSTHSPTAVVTATTTATETEVATATATETAPATPTETATLPPSTPSPTDALTPTPTMTLTPTVAGVCVGDCDADRRVTVAELITGVNIALDRAAVATCHALDRDGDQRVTVAELVEAVSRALGGCLQ